MPGGLGPDSGNRCMVQGGCLRVALQRTEESARHAAAEGSMEEGVGSQHSWLSRAHSVDHACELWQTSQLGAQMLSPPAGTHPGSLFKRP